MTISVIIPTLNEARVIADTLTHTGRLGFDELIVVDGGSQDGTPAIAEAHASGSRMVTAPCGRARQMNAGAQAGRGEILLFLHADTYLPSAAKERIVAALADRETVGGRFDVRFDRPTLLGRIISTMMNYRSRWSGVATGDQAIFVRKQTFDRLGGFADIPLMEDVDFSRRLKRMGRQAMLRDQVVTSFRRWEIQGSIKTILLMWGLRFLYWIGVNPRHLQRFYRAVR